ALHGGPGPRLRHDGRPLLLLAARSLKGRAGLLLGQAEVPVGGRPVLEEDLVGAADGAGGEASVGLEVVDPVVGNVLGLHHEGGTGGGDGDVAEGGGAPAETE